MIFDGETCEQAETAGDAVAGPTVLRRAIILNDMISSFGSTLEMWDKLADVSMVIESPAVIDTCAAAAGFSEILPPEPVLSNVPVKDHLAGFKATASPNAGLVIFLSTQTVFDLFLALGRV